MQTFKILIFLMLFISINSYLFSQNKIKLGSEGSLSVDADQLILSISIEGSGSSKDSLNKSHHEKILGVLQVLKDYNYKEKDIYLISSEFDDKSLFNDFGIYDESSSKNSKYIARQSYRIIVKDFKIYDTLKKDLLNKGTTSIDITSFWVSNYEDLKKKVYKQALENAKSKALLLSGVENKNKIKLLEISDNTRNYNLNDLLEFVKQTDYSGDLYCEAAPSKTRLEPTITNAKVNISASINVIFEI